MKLIYLITLILWLDKTSNAQKFNQEQYSFPPQFKPPNAGVFRSDSSIYLPPESHTTVSYFSMNNGNKLPYQFLPPTATKIPSVYPTPFPMMMSSTMMSRRDEDDADDEEEEIIKRRVPHVTPPSLRMNTNQTIKNFDQVLDKDMRPKPKTFNNFQNPIDRIDVKFSPQFHSIPQKTQPTNNQNPPSQRRMIISSEIIKNENVNDQVKRASILGPQFISSPVAYYSTTEPAIPILRLSNEMDLDGSFSYEALGADQTHYVQHSRVENSGTDKEEQVVEGSYSYVGDNGQTYTVHYVADSNGYRASGDHLPVPPPVPEIIQRAVQFNLAEEAKRPEHLKNWQDNEKEYDHTDNEKHRFSIPPPRNLFTGRTPEAFSFGLTQTSVLQNNIPGGDSQVLSTDQSKIKINNGPIAPQITFLASQGAHNPTINSGQQASRIFATEKPTLPQIMNYEAGSSESDQENNKSLWRWQYGLNANSGNENQHPNKNSISRSFGEGDDVIINFNNMSPEQYTNLMKNEFMEQNSEGPIVQSNMNINERFNAEQSQFESERKNENSFLSSIQKEKDITPIDNMSPPIPDEERKSISSETMNLYPASTGMKPENVQYSTQNEITYSESYSTKMPLATQTEEFLNNPYDFNKLNVKSVHMTTQATKVFDDNYNKNIQDQYTSNTFASTTENSNKHADISTKDSIFHDVENIKFTDFIQKEEEKTFKPIIDINLKTENSQETTTIEPSPENIIRENYFLKNLFKSDNVNFNRKLEKNEEPQKPSHNKINLEPKFDKVPKFIQYQQKPQNEIKNVVKKPLDLADVMNYITLKNYFESSKLQSKNKFSNSDKLNQRSERPQIFIPLENHRDSEEEHLDQEETQNNLRTLNNQKQQELRGIIKNYKVLQRNNNGRNLGQNRNQFMTEAAQRHLKTMQTQNLPPLGRAGPSVKSYLPPTYL